MDGKICCFTGHRSISESEIVQIPSALGKIIDELYNNGVREFRAGGAIGFDTLAALKVISRAAPVCEASSHTPVP